MTRTPRMRTRPTTAVPTTAVPTTAVPATAVRTRNVRTRSATSGPGAKGRPGQTGRRGYRAGTRRDGRPAPARASRTDPGSPPVIHRSPGSPAIPAPDASAGRQGVGPEEQEHFSVFIIRGGPARPGRAGYPGSGAALPLAGPGGV